MKASKPCFEAAEGAEVPPAAKELSCRDPRPGTGNRAGPDGKWPADDGRGLDLDRRTGGEVVRPAARRGGGEPRARALRRLAGRRPEASAGLARGRGAAGRARPPGLHPAGGSLAAGHDRRGGVGDRGRWQRLAAIAAVLLLLVAGAALWAALPPGFAIALLADHHTTTAEQRTVTLPEGSTVVLGAASALSVELDGATAARRAASWRGLLLGRPRCRPPLRGGGGTAASPPPSA